MESAVSLEESALIATMRAGHVDAFAGVVDKYHLPIFRYLYRLTGDYEAARDLAQDTFVQAYEAILKTDSDLRLKAWLFRIATNNAWRRHRRKRLLGIISFDGSQRPPADRKSPDSDPAEDLAIQQALGQVPAEQRACLVLHFVEGFKYQEIGQTLGISEEAVRKRVMRGKQSFRKAYGDGEQR